MTVPAARQAAEQLARRLASNAARTRAAALNYVCDAIVQHLPWAAEGSELPIVGQHPSGVAEWLARA